MNKSNKKQTRVYFAIASSPGFVLVAQSKMSLNQKLVSLLLYVFYMLMVYMLGDLFKVLFSKELSQSDIINGPEPSERRT